MCGFSDCLGDLKIAWSNWDCCVDFDCLQSRRVGSYFRCSAFVLCTLHVLILVFDTFLSWDGAQGTSDGNFKVQSLRKENKKFICRNLIAGEGRANYT